MSRTTHRAVLVSLLAAVALVAGACGGGDSGGGGGGDVAGGSGGGGEEAADIGPADVTIVNFAYEDAEYTTAVGEEVVWINDGAAPHTVTGDDFDSGVVRSGNGWTHTFEEAGTYEYWCTNHEGAMSGTIIVE
jgi:plastocyanin